VVCDRLLLIRRKERAVRLIDADALKANCDIMVGDTTIGRRDYVMFHEIDTAPSIDIVRCKECKHNYNKVLNHGKMQPRCDFTDRKLSEDDYCSRGEREGE
jgi:hypothetical protein